MTKSILYTLLAMGGPVLAAQPSWSLITAGVLLVLLSLYLSVRWLANTKPIYTNVPNVNAVAITAANTKSDGQGTIGTDIFKAFTAGSNGSFVSKVRLSPVATVAATATTATVFRIFISSKTSGATTQADTWLIQEVSAPSQTADSSSTATNFLEVPLNVPIPAGYTILVTSHGTMASNTSWTAVVFGGDY